MTLVPPSSRIKKFRKERGDFLDSLTTEDAGTTVFQNAWYQSQKNGSLEQKLTLLLK
jgi:hypothetical protein